MIVWLGDGDGDSEQAMDVLAQTVEVKRIFRNMGSKYNLGFWARQSVSDWISAISRAPVVGLLARNHWKRLWIIQELALNHSMTMFMCGTRKVPRQAVWGTCRFIRGCSREIHQALPEQC